MRIEVATRYPLSAWLVTVAAWVWFLFAVYYFTDAACQFPAVIAMAASGMFLGSVWLVQTMGRPQRLLLSERGLWLSVPFAGLLGCVLLVTDWGLTLRVALSESALSERAENAIEATVADGRGDRIGLFRVDEVRMFDGGVYFYTSYSYLNRHGVAHLPSGSAPAPRTRVRHLYGQWYSFEWKF